VQNSGSTFTGTTFLCRKTPPNALDPNELHLPRASLALQNTPMLRPLIRPAH
jgi:hypothetical protein